MRGMDLLIHWLNERNFYVPDYDRLEEGFSAPVGMTTFRVGRRSRAFIGNILWIGIVDDDVYCAQSSFSRWRLVGSMADPNFFEKFGELFEEFDVRPDPDDVKFMTDWDDGLFIDFGSGPRPILEI